MKQISPEMKRAVYETIKSQGNFYGKYAEGYYADDDLNIVNFLKLIWDLPAMKSDDSRFRNAEADATQHLINNDDWDTDYIFEKGLISWLEIKSILSNLLNWLFRLMFDMIKMRLKTM